MCEQDWDENTSDEWRAQTGELLMWGDEDLVSD